MKITAVRLRNFLTFGEEPVVIDELQDSNIVVGPNGGGKTSLLRAIEYVGLALAGSAPWPGEYVHGQDASRGIELDVSVRLNDQEVSAAVTSCLYSAIANMAHPSVQGLDQIEADRVISAVIQRSSGLFQEPMTSELHFVTTSDVGHAQDLRTYVRTSSPKTGLCFDSQGRVTRSPFVANAWATVDLQNEVYSLLNQVYSGAFVLGSTPTVVEPELIQSISNSLTSEWLYERLKPREGMPIGLNLTSLQSLERFREPQGQPTNLIALISFLARRGDRQRRLSPFEVLTAIFNSCVVRLSDARSKFASGPELEAENGPGSSQRVSGFNLARDLFVLKNSSDTLDRRRYAELQKRFEKLTRVSFDAVLATRTIPPATKQDQPGAEQYETLVFTEGQVSYPSGLAAAGFCEILLVLYSALGPTDSVLLLDEPALNLHPSKQAELRDALAGLASEANNQLVIVTHSPAFIAVSDLTSVVRIFLREGRSRAIRLNGGSAESRTEAEKLLSVTPELASVLFAKRVVLVEGEDEEVSLPEWFSKCLTDVDLGATGTIFVNVHGNLSFSRFARVLSSWGLPYRMVGDGGSSEILSKFPGVGFCYPQKDFTTLVSEYCSEVMKEAEGEWGGRKKDPLLARIVAQRTDPPPPVRELFESLRHFVEGRAD